MSFSGQDTREKYIQKIAEEMQWAYRSRIERAREMVFGTGVEITPPVPEPSFRVQAEAMLDAEIVKTAGDSILARFREQAVAAERGA